MEPVVLVEGDLQRGFPTSVRVVPVGYAVAGALGTRAEDKGVWMQETLAWRQGVSAKYVGVVINILISKSEW